MKKPKIIFVNWENNGFAIRNNPKSTIRNEKYFYKDGITWSDVGINGSTFRYFPQNMLRDNRGPAIFTILNEKWKVHSYSID